MSHYICTISEDNVRELWVVAKVIMIIMIILLMILVIMNKIFYY